MKAKTMKRKKSKVSVRRTVLTTLCVILAVILVAGIGFIAYVEGMLGKLNRDPDSTFETMSESEFEQLMENEDATSETDFDGEEMNATDVEWDEETLLFKHEDVINLLLIGQDRRPGEKSKYTRSDAMILVTINKAKKTITMSSLMRDMYVQIPGKKDNRINASYAMGGIKLLNETIKKNFGVTIDGNIVVDFTGFMEVIDVVGGVDIKLTKAEARYLNTTKKLNDQPKWKRNLKEGMNHLDANQALAYSRIRKIGSGDFGRTNRQRKILKALVNKVKDLSLVETNEMLNKLLPLITTDLKDAEILGYAGDLLPALPYLTVETQQIPAEGTYKLAKIDGKSVIVPNFKENKKILQEIMSTE